MKNAILSNLPSSSAARDRQTQRWIEANGFKNVIAENLDIHIRGTARIKSVTHQSGDLDCKKTYLLLLEAQEIAQKEDAEPDDNFRKSDDIFLGMSGIQEKIARLIFLKKGVVKWSAFDAKIRIKKTVRWRKPLEKTDLSKELGLSPKQVRYEVKKINDYLIRYGKNISKSNRGFVMNADQLQSKAKEIQRNERRRWITIQNIELPPILRYEWHKEEKITRFLKLRTGIKVPKEYWAKKLFLENLKVQKKEYAQLKPVLEKYGIKIKKKQIAPYEIPLSDAYEKTSKVLLKK